MPITGIGSYGPTTGQFLVNWAQANTELVPQGLVLAGGYSSDDFGEDRGSLLSLIDEVSALAQLARETATVRDALKIALNERAKQFRGAVQSKIADKEILKELPKTANPNLDEAKFSEPLKAMNRLWLRINANAAQHGLSSPLTLQGDYTQSGFAAQIAELSPAYDAATGAEEKIGFARAARNNAMAAIYERMKQYRAGAPAALPANSPALAQLPRLTPEAGTTPGALVVTGAYDAATGEAVFSFPVATGKNLLKLQVRACTGTSYKAGEEESIGDLPLSATEFRTNWGLSVPGAKIVVKIYVMTTTGNENGGKAVKIVRPETV